MKAIQFYGINDLRSGDKEIPEIGAKDLLIKVKAAAICGTDLRISRFGHFKINPKDRRILGHEVSGEIVQAGEEVKGFQIGERVAAIPNIGCGHCELCRKGLNQLCAGYEAFGISLDGGFAEYMRVPEQAIVQGNLVKLPNQLSYEEAVLVEPLSCCYNSWKSLQTVPGDTVLVVGAGPIGAMHVMMNHLAGAAKIIVADISDSRLKEVRRFGADVLVNSSVQDLKDAVLEETEGAGADVVITACSVPEIQQLALELSAVEGRINFFGGMPKGKELVAVNTNLIHYKQLKVMGTTGSSIQDYCASMKLAASGKCRLEDLVSARFSLEQADEAFAYAASGQGMKTIFVNQ